MDRNGRPPKTSPGVIDWTLGLINVCLIAYAVVSIFDRVITWIR